MTFDKKIVAVCTSRIFEEQHFSFLKQMCEMLSQRDMIVLIFAINTDLYWEEDKYSPEASVFDNVPFDVIDLLLIMDEKIKSRTVSQKLIDNAKKAEVPVVVVDGDYEGTVKVKFDYQKGFERVVRHIIEHHKVRKPFMIAGLEGNPFSDERIGVFKKVLEENGIGFTPDMMAYGDFWAAPARNVMSEVIKSGDIPDAVICANDIMAINAMDVLVNAGIKVPDDVKVSGFDGIDEVSMCSPMLTTASCGSDVLAKAVTKCITDCLNGHCPDEILIEPELITNGSCGCSNSVFCSSVMPSLNHFNNGFYRYQDDIRVMYDIATAMQLSRTPKEAAGYVRSKKIKDIHCFVFSECFEKENDYFASPLLTSKKEKFVLFYDSYKNEIDLRDVSKKDMKKFIYRAVRGGTPIIVNALDFRGKPIGYVCYTFDGYDFVEYAKTANVTNTLSMGLGGLIATQYQRYLSAQVEEMYRIDPLTGLYNRSGFKREYEKLCDSPEWIGKEITIIMADLDDLKYINDTFGHEAGDEAIALAAKALKYNCPEDSLCVRFGGDEMFSIMVGNKDENAIIAAIDDWIGGRTLSGSGCKVSMSCGGCHYVFTEDFCLSEALGAADEEMYINKRRRKKMKE